MHLSLVNSHGNPADQIVKGCAFEHGPVDFDVRIHDTSPPVPQSGASIVSSAVLGAFHRPLTGWVEMSKLCAGALQDLGKFGILHDNEISN